MRSGWVGVWSVVSVGRGRVGEGRGGVGEGVVFSASRRALTGVTIAVGLL